MVIYTQWKKSTIVIAFYQGLYSRTLIPLLLVLITYIPWLHLVPTFQCWYGTSHYNWITSIPVWISNHMPSKVKDEITDPFPNFNGCTVKVWQWISNFPTPCNGCNYFSMLGLNLTHVSNGAPDSKGHRFDVETTWIRHRIELFLRYCAIWDILPFS